MKVFSKCLLTGLLSCFASLAFAELDPELAQANNKNESGMFLGGGLMFGQSYRTGGSTPGASYFALVEPGYVSNRDSWGRIEASLELGMGELGFREKSSGDPKVAMPVSLMGLVKIGYGWSLGDSLFNLVKIGAGPAIADYEAKSNGATTKSDGSLSGLAGMLSYDLVFPMGSALDLTGGFRITHFSFDLDDVKIDGVAGSADEPVNVNLLALHMGVRLTF